MTARRDGAALALGSALNGVLGYGVFALTTRGLGAADAAPVAVLWSLWALCGAAVTFPLQHLLTATGGRAVAGGPELARLGGGVAAVAGLLGVVTGVLREPLFDSGGASFPLVAAMLGLGAGLMGVVRGLLAAAGRFGWLAVSLASENAVRCVAVLVLAVAGVDDPVPYAVCLLSGYVVAVAAPLRVNGGASHAGTVTSPWRFLTGAGSAQLLHQVVLTTGPLLAAPLGAAPAAVTGLFTATALCRAPFLVALGVVPRLNRSVALRVAGGDLDGVGRSVRSTLLLTAVASALAAPVAAAVGPALLRLLFGAVELSRLQAAVVAAASVLAVANLVLGVVALVSRAPTLGTRAWLAAACADATVVLGCAGPLGLAAVDAVVLGFLAAEVVACGVLARSTMHAVRRTPPPA